MSRGLFVTIEGIEGSGKSTLAKGLAAKFGGTQPVVLTREPGGTEIGGQIRSILLAEKTTALVPTAELLLFAADRAQHVEEKIKPALDAGSIVICDRFIHSTLAYQGYGRGLDLALLKELNKTAAAGVKHDLVILLDFEPEAGMERIKSRSGAGDRIELQGIEFHRRVRNGFLELAKQHPGLFIVLDAKLPPEKLVDACAARISELIAAGDAK